MLLRSIPSRIRQGGGRRVGVAVLLATLVATVAVLVLPLLRAAPPDASASPGIVSGWSQPGPGSQETDIPADSSSVPGTTGPASEASDPDQFARFFAAGLLEQDFRRPRTALLSWVQAHAAVSPEPLVMGLIPVSDRPTWAVASVSDASLGETVVPGQEEWAELARASGYQSVEIKSVSEPYAWVAAVAASKITDPGVTAREIVAVVTRRTSEGETFTA